jgi:Ca2+-binding EF-hand superfamily protein
VTTQKGLSLERQKLLDAVNQDKRGKQQLARLGRNSERIPGKCLTLAESLLPWQPTLPLPYRFIKPLSLAQEVAQMRATVALVLAVALLFTSTEQASAQQEGGRSSSGYDAGQYFDRMSGGQSVWVRPEIADRKQAFFDRVAASLGITNGQITRQQWLSGQRHLKKTVAGGKGLAPRKPAPGQAAGESFDQYVQKQFKRLDLNGDGFLNTDEVPRSLRENFARWDRNKDGLIDLQEYRVYLQAWLRQNAQSTRRSGADTNPENEGRPVVYRPGSLPEHLLPAWFLDLDTDRDGQIGLYEWRKAGKPIDQFLAMDRNNDGFLTVEEVLYYQAAQARKADNSQEARVASISSRYPAPRIRAAKSKIVYKGK